MNFLIQDIIKRTFQKNHENEIKDVNNRGYQTDRAVMNKAVNTKIVLPSSYEASQNEINNDAEIGFELKKNLDEKDFEPIFPTNKLVIDDNEKKSYDLLQNEIDKANSSSYIEDSQKGGKNYLNENQSKELFNIDINTIPNFEDEEGVEDKINAELMENSKQKKIKLPKIRITKEAPNQKGVNDLIDSTNSKNSPFSQNQISQHDRDLLGDLIPQQIQNVNKGYYSGRPSYAFQKQVIESFLHSFKQSSIHNNHTVRPKTDRPIADTEYQKIIPLSNILDDIINVKHSNKNQILKVRESSNNNKKSASNFVNQLQGKNINTMMDYRLLPSTNPKVPPENRNMQSFRNSTQFGKVKKDGCMSYFIKNSLSDNSNSSKRKISSLNHSDYIQIDQANDQDFVNKNLASIPQRVSNLREGAGEQGSMSLMNKKNSFDNNPIEKFEPIKSSRRHSMTGDGDEQLNDRIRYRLKNRLNEFLHPVNNNKYKHLQVLQHEKFPSFLDHKQRCILKNKKIKKHQTQMVNEKDVIGIKKDHIIDIGERQQHLKTQE